MTESLTNHDIHGVEPMETYTQEIDRLVINDDPSTACKICIKIMKLAQRHENFAITFSPKNAADIIYDKSFGPCSPLLLQ